MNLIKWTAGKLATKTGIYDHIELPRMCASRRMPYVSRYLLDGKRWIYSCSIQIDPLAQYLLYDQRIHETVEFSAYNITFETCPWCNTTAQGVIQCWVCGCYCCYGLRYMRGGKERFRCACGIDGEVRGMFLVQTGIYPKVRAR